MARSNLALCPSQIRLESYTGMRDFYPSMHLVFALVLLTTATKTASTPRNSIVSTINMRTDAAGTGGTALVETRPRRPSYLKATLSPSTKLKTYEPCYSWSTV